jgi:hypothetical protein
VRGCFGTVEGPHVAVLSCAGAYVSGDLGSNACPAGSVRIETEAACRTAAAAAGKTAWSTFVVTYSDFPRGCYYYTGLNDAYFNTHAVGAGNCYTQLLCAALATTGAPPHAPTRRRACAARCSRAVRLIMQTA